MRTVIAEKPSVAKDIARVLGASEKKDGYFEGGGWRVSWALGHLVSLADPAAYDERYGKWSIADLPILPREFIYAASDEVGHRKQLTVIRRLFKEATEIVCATDAGREGEAIFRYIYNEVGCIKPFRRLWISSLTDTAIKEGFSSLKPGSDYDNLFLSAKARNEADWLVGLNATRALTLSCGARQPLSLGRVQTPTLALICRRFLDNRDFTPVKYFTLEAVLEADGRKFTVRHCSKLNEREEAEGMLSRLGGSMRVADRKRQDKVEKAPLPFDITSIQAEANRRFGFKAQKTLDLVQSLYERHKMLTYPRTGSRYLGDDMVGEVEKKLPLLLSLGFSTPFKDAVHNTVTSGMNKACFNSKKLTDHHAIIPTFQNLETFSSLTDDEKRIYTLATTQLVLALMPVCVKDCLSYKFDTGIDGLFEVSGYVIKEAGWRMLYDEKDEDDEDNQRLPDIEVGAIIPILEKRVRESLTKRPPLLTEASLLKAMETAGKSVEDEELSDAMKDCGLGTPATRAAIIETLFKRDYVKTEKNHLFPTELGLKVYELSLASLISDVAMTGEWEMKLNKMAEGKFPVSEFMAGIEVFTREEVKRILSSGAACSITEQDRLICPVCGRPIVQNSKAYGCSGYKDGCRFVVWKEIAGKKITVENVRELIENGETSLIKGFKSKDGRAYDASLKWSAEEERVVQSFPVERKESKDICPLCGKEIREGERSFYCSGYKEGCKFVIWKSISGKKLPESAIKELLEKGVTSLIKGFKTKDGKSFDARLQIEGGAVKFKFR